MTVALAAADAGWWPLYLGADLPAEEIAAAVQKTGARAAAISIISASGSEKTVSEVFKLGQLLRGRAAVFAGGHASTSFCAALRERAICWCDNLEAFHTALIDEAMRDKGSERMTGECDKRAQGALWGLFIGDALAMPVHWYYNREALLRDYGPIHTYLAPRNPHPDSILWRSRFVSPGEGFDILHDQRPFWGQRGVHYHQFLRAGENTLNLQCARLLMESLRHCGRYDADDYLKRYIAFMTTPGRHRDTYAEEFHRHFFIRLASGLSPRHCGIQEKHIGGIAGDGSDCCRITEWNFRVKDRRVPRNTWR